MANLSELAFRSKHIDSQDMTLVARRVILKVNLEEVFLAHLHLGSGPP